MKKLITTMLLTLSLVLACVLGLRVNAAEGDTYKLVTNVSDLNVGDTIIIVNKDQKVALSTNQKSSNRGTVTVTAIENVVSYIKGIQEIILEKGSVDETFAFNVGDGYLYASSSTSNQLKTGKLNDNASWSIEISSGAATIKANGTNKRNCLRYNPNNGSPLFSCYGSTSDQEDISIMKKVIDTTVNPFKESTKASLKLDGDKVSIRFGGAIAADAYNAEAEYGVIYSTDASKLADLTVDAITAAKAATSGDIYATECSPVRVANPGDAEEFAEGNYYQFAVVLEEVPSGAYGTSVSAVMYMIVGNKLYIAQVKTASVKEVAQAYLDGNFGLSEDVLTKLQAIAN